MELGTTATEYEQDIRATDVTEEERDAGEKAAADAFAAAFGEPSGDRAMGTAGKDLVKQQQTDTTAAPAPAATVAAPAPAPTPAAAPAPAEDPFKDLPPAMRETVARLQAVENDNRAMHGRVAPLQRENEQLKQRLAALEGRSPAAAPAPVAADTPERERVRGELPEVARAIDELETRMRASAPAPAPAAAPAPATQQDAIDPTTAAEIQILAGIHPDWQPIMNSRDYLVWQASQTEARRAELASTNRAAPVAVALTEFKVHQQRARDAAAQAQHQAQLRANRTGAAAVPASGRRTLPQGNPDAIDPQAAFLAGFNSA